MRLPTHLLLIHDNVSDWWFQDKQQCAEQPSDLETACEIPLLGYTSAMTAIDHIHGVKRPTHDTRLSILVGWCRTFDCASRWIDSTLGIESGLPFYYNGKSVHGYAAAGGVHLAMLLQLVGFLFPVYPVMLTYFYPIFQIARFRRLRV